MYKSSPVVFFFSSGEISVTKGEGLEVWACQSEAKAPPALSNEKTPCYRVLWRASILSLDELLTSPPCHPFILKKKILRPYKSLLKLKRIFKKIVLLLVLFLYSCLHVENCSLHCILCIFLIPRQHSCSIMKSIVCFMFNFCLVFVCLFACFACFFFFFLLFFVFISFRVFVVVVFIERN